MIKGVNRQIIEVMDTGNPYFERALLVVRLRLYRHGIGPPARGGPADAAQGRRLYRLKRQRRRRYLKAALYGLAAGCVGALAGALISLLCR